MNTSEIVVLSVAGALLLLLCFCCVCRSGNSSRSAKEKQNEKSAGTRINRCFRWDTYIPVFVIFRRASLVLDPCGLSSRRYLNKHSERMLSKASSLRSDRLLAQLRKVFGSTSAPGSSVAAPPINLDPRALEKVRRPPVV